jgi:hypothetical protein
MHKWNGSILRAILVQERQRHSFVFWFWMADTGAPRIIVVIKAVLALGPR